MKFAIRNLALTCVVPSTFLVGLSTRVEAQNIQSAAPTTVVKAVDADVQFLPPKLLPRNTVAAPIRSRTNASPPVSTGGERRPAVSTNRPRLGTIQQVANQAPRPQQPSGGESDVQKQLRALYEKSGQEMPVMDLNEMEVPEPQPGVAPGSQPAAGQPGLAMPAPQNPADAKKPSFFERVFMGKKAPAPQPQPGLQRPAVPNPGVVRPPAGQPGPQYPNGPARPGQPGYRPYAPNPQANPSMQRPGFNQPNGLATQRPNPQAQQRPQVVPADPRMPGVQTAPTPRQSQQPQQLPVIEPEQQAGPQNQTQGQSQVTEQGQSQSRQPQQPQQPQIINPSELPVLEDEPEESLDIDLTPKKPNVATRQQPTPAPQQPSVRKAPVLQANPSRTVIPAPTPTPTRVAAPAAAPTVVAPARTSPERTETSEPADENPFSGLRLSIPEPEAPRIPQKQPVPPKNPVTTQVAKPSPALETNSTNLENPFQDGSTGPTAVPQSPTTTLPPIAPSNSKPPATSGRSGANSIPAIPVSKQSVPHAAPNPFLEPPVDHGPAVSPLEENLRKLAEATEKQGFKGFCPVMLRQHRTLAAAKPQFNALYQGKKFRFSSAEAKARFEQSPQLFAPAHDGLDGVALLDDEKSLVGSLDFAGWYHGRLYMFSSRENLEVFNSDPEQYVDELELEAALKNALSKPAKPNENAPAPVAPVAKPVNSAPATEPSKTPAPNPTAAKPAAPKSVTPQANVPKVSPPKTPAADELPVLMDETEVAEPATPPVNTNRVTVPSSVPKTNRTNVPALSAPTTSPSPKSTTPRTQVPQKPAATPGTPKPEGPVLEGPKLQGPKLNALATPIKPASGVENQKYNPAPKLIKPAPRVAVPPVKTSE